MDWKCKFCEEHNYIQEKNAILIVPWEGNACYCVSHFELTQLEEKRFDDLLRACSLRISQTQMPLNLKTSGLSKQQKDTLKKFADECQIDIPTLILILERLPKIIAELNYSFHEEEGPIRIILPDKYACYSLGDLLPESSLILEDARILMKISEFFENRGYQPP
jgi:hypothetical protein